MKHLKLTQLVPTAGLLVMTKPRAGRNISSVPFEVTNDVQQEKFTGYIELYIPTYEELIISKYPRKWLTRSTGLLSTSVPR